MLVSVISQLTSHRSAGVSSPCRHLDSIPQSRRDNRTTLSPLEFARHVARCGSRPPVYQNLLTNTITELHPFASFLDAGVALHHTSTVKARCCHSPPIINQSTYSSIAPPHGHLRGLMPRPAVCLMLDLSLASLHSHRVVHLSMHIRCVLFEHATLLPSPTSWPLFLIRMQESRGKLRQCTNLLITSPPVDSALIARQRAGQCPSVAALSATSVVPNPTSSRTVTKAHGAECGSVSCCPMRHASPCI